MHTEGQGCMKVLKSVNKDLSSLSSKATQWKAELVTLEKKVQKQNEKMLKLMEHIDSVLECVNELEDQVEECDKKIWALEEVEELKLKVCRCARAEEETDAPKEVRRGYRMCLIHSDLFPYRNPLGWSTNLRVLTPMTQRT